ncbi:MAG TPA: hypothetical protein VJT80_07825 [Steroidobacteraceae bacterium]|nr:hypothetical protein [Steroidobacteraceae bacterium]
MAILVVLVIAEWAFVSPQLFAILSSDAVDSPWRLIPMLSLPRFLVGLCAGLVFAVVYSRAMRLAALGAYVVLLLWSFVRSDVHVRWSDVHAVVLAIVPYAAGLVGMALGFALRRPIRRRLNLS